ncbi:MAG TPA: hypothetical protein VNL71_16465 [Chloroflexota bacterium]|nr:hypothetical protein [Chloroflexota bacterium]
MGLYVQGTLLAEGTATQPIIFKGVTPGAGNWTGLFFDGAEASRSRLRYVTVADAGRAYDGAHDHDHGGWLCASGVGAAGTGGGSCENQGILLRTADPSLDHLTIEDSYTDGLRVLADVPPLHPSNVAFKGNGGYAVHLQTIASLPRQLSGIALGPSSIALDGGTLPPGASIQATEPLTYTLLGYTTISRAATLSLAPGSVVQGSGDVGLYVQGTLLAEGTATGPIVFEGVTAGAGVWTGLFFDGAGASGSRLRYVTVAGAGRSYEGAHDVQHGGWLCGQIPYGPALGPGGTGGASLEK